MRKFLIIIFIFNCNVLLSQDKANDSLRTYNKQEVIISATRSEILRKNSPSFNNIITGISLSEMNGNQISDKLQQVNGIFLKDYGPGGLKTLSMRGLGPEHSLVLFNGEKLNSLQNGNVDLSNYLTEDIERIEIIRGGNSAFYGSEAIGGIINIIPKTEIEKFGVQTSFSAGSFDYFRYFVKLQNKFDKIELSASFNQEKASNEFNYRFYDQSDLYAGNRKNSDFLTRYFQAGLNYKINESSSIFFINKINYAEKGIPDIIISPDLKSRQEDKDNLIIISYKNQLTTNFDIKVSPTYHFSSLNYINPKFNTDDKKFESKSDNYNYGLNSQYRLLFSGYELNGGMELSESKSTSNNYTGEKNRFQIGTYFSSSIEFPGLPLLIYPAIRFDNYSDFGSALSPKLGINFKILDEYIIVKSSYSRNFRAPTFNELYWKPGGNINLKPEKTSSFETGFNFNTIYPVNASFEFAYFRIVMDNRIIWLPSGGFLWEPKNVQDVVSNGIELSANCSLPDDIAVFNINYSFTNSKNMTKNDNNYNKFLPYIPIHSLRSSLNISIFNIGINLFYNLTGERYSTESNEKNTKLPYFHYLNGAVSHKFTIWQLVFNVRYEINNIFNSEYVIMPYYPTALRNYKINLSINY